MDHRTLKRKELIRLATVYSVMTLAVLIIVAFIVFFVQGYRFNADDGRIEQYAFLQFASNPSGATVTVDGQVIGSKTPNKSSNHAGKHDVVMWRDGYETWNKSVDLKAGTITWLNYAILVPKKLDVEPVANYGSVYQSLASPLGHYMLIQKSVSAPSFDLIDLSSDTIKSTSLVVPTNLYSDANTAGVTHAFRIVKWDDGGRYVLVKHTYSNKDEWLVMDTQNVALTKNITRAVNTTIDSISFSGTNGNSFYILGGGDIRKIDLSSGNISQPFVSNVKSFEIYESNIITYIGTRAIGAGEQVAGLYRDGDSSPHILRSTADMNTPLHIATTHYFHENYIAISDGKKVDVLSGSYPNTPSEDATSMKIVASFEPKESVSNLSFSPIGEYVLVQSGAYFASYDLEYKTFASSTIAGTGTVATLKWLDDNYLWSDRDGSLTIREFDGANTHTFNSVSAGQDAALTHNGRYIYSINKSATGYQLQRVRMILP